ncbi:ABC transporter ATP-binding protein [Myroides sp. LJL119]
MKNNKKKTGIMRLLEITGSKKVTLIVAAILSVIHAVLSLVPYILVYYIIKELLNSSTDYQLIKTYLIYAIIASVISMLLFFLSGVMAHIAAYNVLHQLRTYIANKVGVLPMGYLTTKNSGALKKILSDDVERIEHFISHQIPDFVKGISLPLLTLGYLFSQDYRLALISFLPIVLIGIIIPKIFATDDGKELLDRQTTTLENMNAGIVEYVRAIPVMKIFGQSADSFNKFGNTIIEYRQAVHAWTKKSVPGFALFTSVMNNAMLPLLALGLYLYFNNGLSTSTLLLFLILGTGYIKPIFALSNMAPQLALISNSMAGIDNLLDQETLPESNTLQAPLNYQVSFENVSFAYEDKEVLHNVSFTVKQNSIAALVGPSGAGKSTIGQLLARFWDTNKGSIKIGGIDVKDYPTSQLMEIISFVFQDSFMFQQSLFENIRMGMNKTTEQVQAAAKAAQIHDMIMSLPDQYDTLYGQSGVHLSGGEQQRIQLARAILKDAPILILDEATAYADPENELKTQQAFSSLIKNKTVLIIAHRLSTITDVDQILVFDKGNLVGKDTHPNLLEHNLLYQRLWNAHTRAKDIVL